MSFQQTFDILRRPPDGRPIRDVEQEILDELAFHIEMRTLENERAGMFADEARQDAMERFGDFERIHKKCRQTLLGERIMLQRVQAVLTVALLGAVVFLSIEFYRGQRANEAATARMMEMLGKATTITTQPATAAAPQFEILFPPALDRIFPNDAKCTEIQRKFRDWSEMTFPAINAAWWQKLSPTEKADWEEKWLNELSGPSEKQREMAIKCLTTAGCKKAIPEILKIATERVEKDNADRCEAVRALGILGDISLVPELVPLAYHYNMNTRLWAQVALVRLTGENFGRDVAAWKAWWEKQGKQPPISEEIVVWAKSPWMLSMLQGAEDPKKQDAIDREFVENNGTAAPMVVQTVPKSGDRNVDPSLTEIRVTYNKEMRDHSWSWCYDAKQLKTTGDPRYENNGKTCVLPVKLEPGKVYTISLNTNQFRNFKDAVGQPAIPYVLQFNTRKEASSDDSVKPQAVAPQSEDRPKIISATPAPNATDVDPHTEIRIRFDQPMNPNEMGLVGNRNNPPFRLSGSPRYVSDTQEFVMPVVLKPGMKYDFKLEKFVFRKDESHFKSVDGKDANPYAWQFTTRDLPADSKAASPSVVSIDPPSGAETGMVTAIRVCFDRPMDPEAFEIADLDGMEASVPFPVEYDAASHGFTFQTMLPRSVKIRLELRGFRSAEGAPADPVTVEYQVGRELYLPEQKTRIAEAGRLAKLREVVEAVRRNRLTIKSLEETVCSTMLFPDRKCLGWLNQFRRDYGRFGFQGDGEFYTDVTSIMSSPPKNTTPNVFRLGSNGHECWFLAYNYQANENQVIFCPSKEMPDRTVRIGDPFGVQQYSSTEIAIEQLQLEYLGEVTHEGKACHRMRSWNGDILMNKAHAIDDWLIDAQSLLPVTCTHNGMMQYEFLYHRINEPIASEAFRATTDTGMVRKPLELEEGYGQPFLKACDGSDGRMSARWGQKGSSGTKDSGLN